MDTSPALHQEGPNPHLIAILFSMARKDNIFLVSGTRKTPAPCFSKAFCRETDALWEVKTRVRGPFLKTRAFGGRLKSESKTTRKGQPSFPVISPVCGPSGTDRPRGPFPSPPGWRPTRERSSWAFSLEFSPVTHLRRPCGWRFGRPGSWRPSRSPWDVPRVTLKKKFSFKALGFLLQEPHFHGYPGRCELGETLALHQRERVLEGSHHPLDASLNRVHPRRGGFCPDGRRAPGSRKGSRPGLFSRLAAGHGSPHGDRRISYGRPSPTLLPFLTRTAPTLGLG